MSPSHFTWSSPPAEHLGLAALRLERDLVVLMVGTLSEAAAATLDSLPPALTPAFGSNTWRRKDNRFICTEKKRRPKRIQSRLLLWVSHSRCYCKRLKAAYYYDCLTAGCYCEHLTAGFYCEPTWSSSCCCSSIALSFFPSLLLLPLVSSCWHFPPEGASALSSSCLSFELLNFEIWCIVTQSYHSSSSVSRTVRSDDDCLGSVYTERKRRRFQMGS